MSVMAQVGFDRVSRAVLGVLRKRANGMAPEKLVAGVLALNPHFTDLDVKRAVWHLIARHQVSLSSHQLLMPAKRSQRGRLPGANKRRLPLQRST